MKIQVGILLSIVSLAGAGTSRAQAPAAGAVVDVSACEVANHPSRYDGKMVRIKGLVQIGFNSFLIRGESCSSPVWLSYPAGTKAKAGPAAVITMQLAANATAAAGPARPAVTLERNKDFEDFDNLLSQRPKTPGMCLGCVKNNVRATLVGRVDGTDSPGLVRDASGKITGLTGFGNLSQYSARLVLQSVSGVSAEPIDLSKAPVSKGDNQGASKGDAAELVKTAQKSFPAGSPTIAQLDRAIGAFGAPGVSNGVIVSFGATAEVPPGDSGKGSATSPDELLFLAAFDPSLKGDALSRAMVHVGSEIADSRDKSASSYKNIEQTAWQATLVDLIGARQKTMMLPGGSVIWNDQWPEAERTTNASAGLQAYLSDHEQTP